MSENDKYADIYSDLAILVGEENMKAIYKRYNGLKIDFPKRMYSREYVKQMIKKNQGKKSVAEFAQMFDYSERYIRKMIAEIKGE